jgi:hypothetical protein
VIHSVRLASGELLAPPRFSRVDLLVHH